MAQATEIVKIATRAKEESELFAKALAEVKRVIVGQDLLLDRLMIGMLTQGHLLLEGVPGLAKTLAVKTLASVLQARFSRVQFTPDLLPADIVGTRIYNQKTGDFSVTKGPIFANLVLADEINRAPAKVQSALLEAMQERQVTIGTETFQLPEPFLVLATQNPIETEGTYPLPEAQVDRFMMKVLVTYPTRDEEMEILNRHGSGEPPEAKAVLRPRDVLEARATAREIYVDDKVKRYIVDLVFATREPESVGLSIRSLIEYGASPRASLWLTAAAKAQAFLAGRGFATPDDVRSVVHDVLRHRVLLTYEAEAEGKTADDLIGEIVTRVKVP